MPRRAVAARKSRVAYYTDTLCVAERAAPERSGAFPHRRGGRGPGSPAVRQARGGRLAAAPPRSSRAGGHEAWIYALPALLGERASRC
jgi:hypothetical protein